MLFAYLYTHRGIVRQAEALLVGNTGKLPKGKGKSRV